MTKTTIDNLAWKMIESKLEELFKVAKDEGNTLWPDDAMRELAKFMGKVIEIEGNVELTELPYSAHRKKGDNVSRKAHLYAVDLFYTTYFLKSDGAPSFSEGFYKLILELDRKGLNHREIAKKVGLAVSTPQDAKLSKDKVRKAIERAKKREVVGKLS